MTLPISDKSIQRAIANYNLEQVFYNINVNKKVLLFTEIVLNIICNFITHETVTFAYRDTP